MLWNTNHCSAAIWGLYGEQADGLKQHSQASTQSRTNTLAEDSMDVIHVSTQDCQSCRIKQEETYESVHQCIHASQAVCKIRPSACDYILHMIMLSECDRPQTWSCKRQHVCQATFCLTRPCRDDCSCTSSWFSPSNLASACT